MKTRLLFIFTLLLVNSGLETGFAANAKSASVEAYSYQAIPEGDEGGRRETIDVEITRNATNIRYKSRRISPAGLEEIEIEMDPVSIHFASRRFSPFQRQRIAVEKIWREHDKAYLQKGVDPAGTIRSYDLHPEKFFAVDGSLLILMRGFPFGSDTAWPIYMVDFSGSSVTITLRLKGIERVAVPAGTYDCYKMEATVELPILKPRIIFWIAKHDPHFLVKSIGKQGPFTPSYETSLLSLN